LDYANPADFIRKTVAGLAVVSNTSIADLLEMPLCDLFEYNGIFEDMLKKQK
jgi:hypothetical protein